MTTSVAFATETTPPLTTPSPLMGTYGTAQNVALACLDGAGSGCAATYYCQGSGCTPTNLYSGPVSIATTTTLSFYSTDLDGNSEQVRTYAYTVDPSLGYRFSRIWPQLQQPWYFNTPHGVAVDPGGNVYVADTGNNRIQKFDSSGKFVTAWGAYGIANGQFSFPSGISLNPAGNVYVADSGNDRIQKFTANGEFLTAWGSTGSDPGQFSQPLGIAADSAGNIYVIEGNNARIQKFDSSGTFAGAWGSSGSDDGQFNAAYGITVDSIGNVYVADTGNSRIQKFDSGGTYLTSWGSDGSGNGQFFLPSGITIDATGNIYVSDTFNQRIQKFTAGGVFVTAWGSEGSGTGQLSYPMGIATDSGGNVYSADTSNQRIQKFDSSGSPVMVWNSWGSGTGQFNRPGGVTVVNTAGYVYVADSDNHRIQEFNSSGSFIRTWGSYGSGNGQFDSPKGVTLDGTGLVYVADTGNDRIQKFNAWGSILAVWGSSGEGNGQFSAPSAIAVDTAGIMYVLDTGNNRVQKLGAGGDFITSWGSPGSDNGQFDNPKGIAVDTSGNIYVADTDNSRIQKFDSNGTFITSWGSYGSGNGEFESPHGITVDAAGFVYVTDANNNVIQKFDSSGAFITAWGSDGSGNGEFESPQGICVDSSNGTVFIADAVNNRIQKFNPPLLPGMPTGVTAVAGYGQAIISFMPPTANGSSPVLSYRATSSPGNITATGSSSPITVTGLSGGTTYTFTVAAINNGGTGPASAPSNSVTPDTGHFLTLTVNGSGTVHSSPTPDISCTGSCSQSYASGTVVDLTATPGSGYIFFGWSGACSGSGSCSVTINQAQSVGALFVFTGSNGICGTAHSGNYSTAPTTNLCTVGTASSVTGIGPWSWSCTGLNGGTTASCSAAQAGGLVHKSSDAGVNWVPGKTGLGFNNSIRTLLTSPAYASDQTLFLGAMNGIYKSSDRGDTWTQVQSSYNVQALAVSQAYASDRTIFAGAFLAGVYKSVDAGVTWALTNTGLGNTRVFSLAVSPAYVSDHTVYAGMYGKGVYKSTDNGATWSAANSGIDTVTAESLVISPAYATDRTILVICGNHIYKSVDAAASWSLADTGLAGSITKLGISPAFASDQTLFAVTSSGIYKSVDGGTLWTQKLAASGSNGIVLSPAYASDQTVLASVYGDTVYRSSNGGSSWSPSSSGLTAGNKQLTTLALSPAFASDQTVFTTTSLIGPYMFVEGNLSFGNVKTNSSSTVRQLTITNGNLMPSDANLAISGLTLTDASAGQFSIAPGTCGSLTPVLAVGASCSFDLTFTPGSTGSKSATLQFTTNDPQNPSWSGSLSGTGIAVTSTIVTPNNNSATNSSSVIVTGTAACSGGCTVSLVEVSADNGITWLPATGTTSWSASVPTATTGSYTFKSRAWTSTGIIETPGSGITVTVDRLAPTGSLALYFGVWTLNANARDGDMCFMVYPSLCGQLEMSLNGFSGWQPATMTPGTSGPLWLRDRAGNVSSPVSGEVWNATGGPIRVDGGLYYSSLQHAFTAAASGNIIKLTTTPHSENLVAATSAALTLRGGYNSSHSSVTGTTPLSGNLTVQAGTLTVENLDLTGSMTVEGGAVTVNAISIL